MINYRHIAVAIEHYRNRGYTEVDAPWLVGIDAYRLTKPAEARDFTIPVFGNLVASGEQSFIQMMLDGGLTPGRHFCTTPCFRDEKVFDDIHRMWFMKVELIDYMPSTDDQLERMISDAKSFFSRYLPVKRIETEIGFDLMTEDGSMELGSYGVRYIGDHVWIYGTGCAEPRLSQAIVKE